MKYLIPIVLIFVLASCEKYKKICQAKLLPKVEVFAVQAALDCQGNPDVAIEFFSKIPRKVCGKQMARALEDYEGDSEKEVAAIVCPLIIKAISYGGKAYVENAIQCKQPFEIEGIETLVEGYICNAF
jgi:hypothetical protein